MSGCERRSEIEKVIITPLLKAKSRKTRNKKRRHEKKRRYEK